MKRNRIMIIAGMILLGLLAATTGYAGEYTLVKKTATISLYEKWITISNGEKARELKVVFYARTNTGKVVTVLRDPVQGKAWNQNVKDYNVLAEPGSNSWVTYIRYSIPWPVGDQDCCLAYTILENGTTAELHFTSTENASFPRRKNAARISGIKGKWLIADAGNGMTRVIYTISSDKSKQLPKWVTDPVIHNNMIKNISAFINLIEKP